MLLTVIKKYICEYNSTINATNLKLFWFFLGECEGCMRDDCGNCSACADKPRFGGRGTKKKACTARICRMRGPPADGRAIVVQQDQDGQTYQIVGYISSDD